MVDLNELRYGFHQSENFRKLQKAFGTKEEELQRDFKACKGLIGKAKVFKIVVRKID